MVRFLTAVTACTLAICTAAAYDATWSNQFKSKINVMPKASAGCSVCFYEQQNFAGPKFCVGKREKGCTKVNPITAPGTIESIKFGKGCDLVVNVRVFDAPYDEHVDVISADVANTGYNLSTDHSVQEVYVEEAGRGCLLGATGALNDYGLCYNKDVPVVDFKYQGVITELMLFKSDAKDFDIIAYEKENYNSLEQTPVQIAVSKGDTEGVSHRFTGYSKELETGETDSVTGMKKTMQRKVRSIKFVSPEDDFTPGSVAPAPYSS